MRPRTIVLAVGGTIVGLGIIGAASGGHSSPTGAPEPTTGATALATPAPTAAPTSAPTAAPTSAPTAAPASYHVECTFTFTFPALSTDLAMTIRGDGYKAPSATVCKAFRAAADKSLGASGTTVKIDEVDGTALDFTTILPSVSVACAHSDFTVYQEPSPISQQLAAGLCSGLGGSGTTGV